MSDKPHRHDLRAWWENHLVKTPEGRAVVDMLMDGYGEDPIALAKRKAKRSADERRALYADCNLDEKSITLREYLDMQDKLEARIYMAQARSSKLTLDTLDEMLTKMDAISSQGGTDKVNTQQQKDIAKLKTEVAELKHQRDELLKRLLAATGAEVVA